jgi:hypothetical protein
MYFGISIINEYFPDSKSGLIFYGAIGTFSEEGDPSLTLRMTMHNGVQVGKKWRFAPKIVS